MDKLYYVFLLLSLVSFSCGNRGTKAVEIEEENEFSTLDALEGVEMWLTPNTFKAGDPLKTARCWFRSDTGEYELTMGTRFAVEKWNGDKWVVFPAFRQQVVLETLLGTLVSKEPAEVAFDFCVSCLADGAKEKGRYRMVIEIEVFQSEDYNLAKAFKAFAEFAVE